MTFVLARLELLVSNRAGAESTSSRRKFHEGGKFPPYLGLCKSPECRIFELLHHILAVESLPVLQ